MVVPHEHMHTLAVLLTRGSFSVFQLAAAARGRFRLLFVIDAADEQFREQAPLLKRLGGVVHATRGEQAEVVEQLRENNASGVVTYTDMALEYAAGLADALDMPFHSREIALGLSDKFHQRRLLREAGIPTPETWLVEAGRADDVDLAAVRLPVVVKPRRGSGSRQVTHAATREQLRAALCENPDEDLLIEEFLADASDRDGQDASDVVSVESVVEHGRHRVVEVTGRFPMAEPFRETGSFMPADLSADQRRQVVQLARDAATALRVERGFLHTEIKLTPDGPRIVEVNGRIGGGIPQMLESIGGPSLIEWSMSMAVDEPLPDDLGQRDGVSFFLWVQAPMWARRVLTLGDVDAVSELEGVETVRVNRGPGTSVDWRVGGLAHVVAVEGRVPDHAALRTLRRRIHDVLQISYA